MKTTSTLIIGALCILCFSISSTAQNVAGNKSASVSSFNAEFNSKAVILSWVADGSNTNNYYETERSFTGKDFSLVGIALDGFEDGSNKDYKFKDNSASLKGQQVAYYRLKKTDGHGSYAYSDIITVKLSSSPTYSVNGAVLSVNESGLGDNAVATR